MTRRSHGFELDVAAASDVGRVRENNEDAHLTRWLDDGSLLVVVADGMGGHAAGEVASGLAVRVLREVVERDDRDPRERLYDGIIEANHAILDEARASNTRGMGTTAITALLRGNEAYVAQVGDSRLYHVRRGHVAWRTTDHTRVQMLIDDGEITPDQARNHPEAGMLTRALGHARMADGQPLTPDVLADPLVLEPGDALVLCSDGLHDLLDDDEIAELVAERAPGEAARRLVDEACARGGHDNVTVAVVVAGARAAAFAPLDPARSVSASSRGLDVARAAPTPPLGTATLAPLPPASASAAARQPPPGQADRRRMVVAVGAVGAVLLVFGAMVVSGAALLAWWMLTASP